MKAPFDFTWTELLAMGVGVGLLLAVPLSIIALCGYIIFRWIHG